MAPASIRRKNPLWRVALLCVGMMSSPGPIGDPRFRVVDTTVWAQDFFSYQDLLEAENRAKAAERRYLISVMYLGAFVTIWLFLFIARRRPLRWVRGPTYETIEPRPLLAVLSRVATGLSICLGLGAPILYYSGAVDVGIGPTFFVLLAFSALTPHLQQMARRYSMSGGSQLTEGSAPILYLRSFAYDETVIAPRSLVGLPQSIDTYEEAIFDGVRGHGDFIAVRNRQLRQQSSSYVPLDVEGDWQAEVGALIRRSLMIIVMVSQTEGLRWEIRELVAARRLAQTIFFLQTASAEGDLKWLLDILQISPETEARRVDIDKSGVALALRVADVPTVYLATPDVGGYAIAAKRAAGQIIGVVDA